MNFLHVLPAPTIWAGLSLVVGAVVTLLIMLAVNRRYGPLQAKALNDLVDLYKKQIAASTGALEMQRSHYEMEHAETKVERDNYRQLLHAEKEIHQATQLRVAELENKPDVSRLYESEKAWNEKREAFYLRMAECLAQIADTQSKTTKQIASYDTAFDERMRKHITPLESGMREIVKSMKELVRFIKKPAGRKGKS